MKTKQGQRQLRVGEQIRHCLAVTMNQSHFRDPDLSDTRMITVTEVQISPDLKNATVFIMTLGGKNIETIINALNRASKFLRSQLGSDMGLRFTPRLSFEIDHTFAQVDKLETLLRQESVARDLIKEEPAENMVVLEDE